jgi:hypothetical protein
MIALGAAEIRILAAAAHWQAAYSRRQEIEDKEICFELAATGEALELIGSQYWTASGHVLKPCDRVVRRLRRPELRAQLEDEARMLDRILGDTAATIELLAPDFADQIFAS